MQTLDNLNKPNITFNFPAGVNEADYELKMKNPYGLPSTWTTIYRGVVRKYGKSPIVKVYIDDILEDVFRNYSDAAVERILNRDEETIKNMNINSLQIFNLQVSSTSAVKPTLSDLWVWMFYHFESDPPVIFYPSDSQKVLNNLAMFDRSYKISEEQYRGMVNTFSLTNDSNNIVPVVFYVGNSMYGSSEGTSVRYMLRAYTTESPDYPSNFFRLINSDNIRLYNNASYCVSSSFSMDDIKLTFSQNSINITQIIKVEVCLYNDITNEPIPDSTTVLFVTPQYFNYKECGVRYYVTFEGRNKAIYSIPCRGREEYSEQISRNNIVNYFEEDKTYATSQRANFKLNTGFLDESDYEEYLIENLMMSNHVVLYDVTTNRHIPVIPQSNSFIRKSFKNDKKLINYSVEFASTKENKCR